MKPQHQDAIAENLAECPMEGNCEVNDVVYKCQITRPIPRKWYLGIVGGKYNSRFYNHKLSFKHKNMSIRQHIQVICGTWKVFQVKTQNLEKSVLRWILPYSNIWDIFKIFEHLSNQ